MASRVEVADGDQLYRIKDRYLVIVGVAFANPIQCLHLRLSLRPRDQSLPILVETKQPGHPEGIFRPRMAE